MRYYGKLPIVLLSELATEKSDSSNCRIAAYLLANLDRADQIGIEQLAEYARAFGFGEYTGIELSGESRGCVASPESK